MGCQNPGRLKRVSVHKTELARVPENEQGDHTVPVWYHSLGCVLGAFGIKNTLVHGRDLSVVLEPTGSAAEITSRNWHSLGKGGLIVEGDSV